MCVEFNGLNDAFRKDPYLLSNIDRLIDRSLVYKTISFMDAHSTYNQIKMDLVEAHNTLFMSNHGNYYHDIIPFEINNACPSYKKFMDVVFSKKIMRNIELYIDDIIVKTS